MIGLSPNASVPIPKFAHHCGNLQCELRNQRDTSKHMKLVWFWFRNSLGGLAATVEGISEPPHWRDYRLPFASAEATANLISASANGLEMTSQISASNPDTRSRWSA